MVAICGQIGGHVVLGPGRAGWCRVIAAIDGAAVIGGRALVLLLMRRLVLLVVLQ